MRPLGEADPVAVDIVVRDRIRMPLKGADRVEAIRQLAEAGLTGNEIALLLKTTERTVQRWAAVGGVVLRGVDPPHWTVEYVESRRDPANRRRWKNGDFTGMPPGGMNDGR